MEEVMEEQHETLKKLELESSVKTATTKLECEPTNTSSDEEIAEDAFLQNPSTTLLCKTLSNRHALVYNVQ